ncbi:UNVERIFIED_CONTAM: hypothetical protein PYX00_009926 [Menopon gallinae]|uniref:MAM domain-containing protein n=1 Tax=Menopon gallinae TaxID=328185 RepID=A0AAW2HDG9_9NEOP
MKCCPMWTSILYFLSYAAFTVRCIPPDYSQGLLDPEEPDNTIKIRERRQETSEICDFGTENDQINCEWVNKNGSALRWEFGAGSLFNWLGGPRRDASGDVKGAYIFFETSLLVSDGRVGQNAFIESPVLPTTSTEGKCISFNYAIDGLSSAGLRVLLHPVTEDDDQDVFDRLLWSSKDPTNKEWMKAEVLYTYNREHKIVFEGVAKDIGDPFRKYRGYVALDNIARKPGTECKGHCTFEGGFCTWFNEDGDDFQWSLGRGSNNPSTGPATDRTSSIHGGPEGGYAFIDSSYPRRPGDIALLSSEDFDPTTPDKPLCLRFWTHMFGNGIGILSVIINDKEDGTDTEIWSLSGEAGNSWYPAEVPISCPNTFRILLVGQVGRNNLGDIAIDDMSLIPGACPISPQIAAVEPGDCRFESDECGWVNSSPRERVDDIDWDRISGQATRPVLNDHTLGTEKGYFMTLAKSNIQRPGSRAWLVSKEIRAQTKPRCLSFWYMLNEPFIDNIGPSLGALAVYVKTFDKNNAVVMTPVWKLYNHQGPEWRHAQTVINEINYTVVFEGTWGSSRANGIIAIDDISLFTGSCTVMPQAAEVKVGECRFDRDTCNWANETQGANARPNSSWKLAVSSRRPANLIDKTFGAPEGYVYFDLFNHNAATNVVRLMSPPITANGDQYCMSFWFAAFGAGEDADLKVIREDNSTSDNQATEVRTFGLSYRSEIGKSQVFFCLFRFFLYFKDNKSF